MHGTMNKLNKTKWFLVRWLPSSEWPYAPRGYCTLLI